MTFLPHLFTTHTTSKYVNYDVLCRELKAFLMNEWSSLRLLIFARLKSCTRPFTNFNRVIIKLLTKGSRVCLQNYVLCGTHKLKKTRVYSSHHKRDHK